MYNVFLNISVYNIRYTLAVQKVTKDFRSIDNKFSRVLCVGHNPAFTEVANLLGNKELIHLPTAGWVKFKFNQSNWKDLKNGESIFGLPNNILN